MSWGSVDINANEDNDKTKLKLETGSHKGTISNNQGVINFLSDGKSVLRFNQVSAVTSNQANFENGINLTGDYVIRDKKQWVLAYRSNYEDIIDEPTEISQCGPYSLLGGYNISSTKELELNFQLPKHSYIQISLNYHFIDFWKGETGYLKIGYGKDKKYALWSQSVDSNGTHYEELGNINVCGNTVTESLLGQRVQVIAKHSDEKLKIFFGSTLECEPMYASYGVSDVEVYII